MSGRGVDLASPLTLPCGQVLPNRLAKAAMTEGLADSRDRPTRAHRVLYERWGLGGPGLSITGNVMVDRRWIERPGNVVVEDRSALDPLRRWAEAGRAGAGRVWMQLNHPGRQANRASTARPVAPSPVGLRLMGMFAAPRAMDKGEIEDAIARFARAAGVAREAGFDGVQVHAAHGYLISQFLSPLANRRDDRWGGDLAGRARFLLAVVRAVRRAVGEAFPVGVKLNSADFQKGGFELSDCVEVARWLDAEGIDLLEISGGTYEQPRLIGHRGRARDAAEPRTASTRRREAYFLDYAREVRAAVGLPLMVTGGFRSRAGMEQALAAGELDAIGLARPLVVDPEVPGRLLSGEVAEAPSPERGLRLPGGRWLGPASPLLVVKAINIQGEMAWYYRQIVRLAEGLDPDPALGLLPALGRHLAGEIRAGRRRRRRIASGP